MRLYLDKKRTALRAGDKIFIDLEKGVIIFDRDGAILRVGYPRDNKNIESAKESLMLTSKHGVSHDTIKCLSLAFVFLIGKGHGLRVASARSDDRVLMYTFAKGRALNK